MQTQQKDKAGEDYWDQNWNQTDLPAPFDPYGQDLDNTFYARAHERLTKIIAGRENLKILEIGCAHSVWPLYFQTYHKAQVDGIDYSDIGCKKTRELWDHYGVKGDIYNADMFNPPSDLIGRYDMVVSFGVMEHFEDTAGALRAAMAFLKPDGQLFTMIPNMSGLIGVIQKWADRDIYNIHVPLSARNLKDSHSQANARVVDSGYFMSVNLGVAHAQRWVGTSKEKIFRRALSIPTKLVWLFERSGLRFPANRVTSPYIYVVAEKNNTDG